MASLPTAAFSHRNAWGTDILYYSGKAIDPSVLYWFSKCWRSLSLIELWNHIRPLTPETILFCLFSTVVQKCKFLNALPGIKITDLVGYPQSKWLDFLQQCLVFTRRALKITKEAPEDYKRGAGWQPNVISADNMKYRCISLQTSEF